MLSQHNMGVSAARNVGLAVAKGKYILFVDPDDYVSSDLLYILRNKLLEFPYDMVLYGFQIENVCSDNMREVFPCLDKDLYSNKEVITHVLPNFLGYSVEHVKNWYTTGVYNPRKEWGAVWRVAYESSLIKDNKILFDTNIVLNEDGVFNMECISHSNSMGVINAALYHYMIRDTGALTKRKKDGLVKNKTALLAARERILEIPTVRNYGIGLKDFAGTNVFSIVEMMFNCDKEDYDDIKAYIMKPSVQESIQMIPKGSNIKFTVILCFLRIKAYRLLFEIIRAMRKLGIKAS